MNTKRQTIWLVSMLSLMVVLSAYYLFSTSTDDLNAPSDLASGQTTNGQVKIDMSQADPSLSVQGDKQAVAPMTENAAKMANGKQTTGQIDPNVQSVQGSARSSEEEFIQQAIEQNEKWSKQIEDWIAIAADPTQSKEKISQAQANATRIEEMSAKVEYLEGKLLKDFKNVLIKLEDDGRWKISVQASKLDKQKAVEIVDLVMKEMKIGADKIAGVQYMQ